MMTSSPAAARVPGRPHRSDGMAVADRSHELSERRHHHPQTYKCPRNISRIEKTAGTGNHLSIPPSPTDFQRRRQPSGPLQDAEKDGQWRRRHEKPFGHDLPRPRSTPRSRRRQNIRSTEWTHFSARRRCRTSWRCGLPTACPKSAVNRQHIDHVQITAAETVGVERRGKFYSDRRLRDMVPNHVPVAALTAMEPPISFDAEAVRDKKAEVIQAIRPLAPARDEDAVRASTMPAPSSQQVQVIV